MAYYIKVTKAVAERLQLTSIRNKTADGNYLLWQADIEGIPGLTVKDRASKVGGVCLTSIEAKREIDGSASVPAKVVTPDNLIDLL